jgi:hypothetical protein
MALTHEFYLIPKTVDIEQFWMDIKNNSEIIDSVVIHDGIILYIKDSIKWIPSKHPALSGIPRGTGINYYGVTLFDHESAIILENVFTTWRNLFENSPKVLKLTGGFVWVEGEERSSDYEKLVFNRDGIIEQFEKVISFAKKLAEGNFYLYHCGI